MKKLYFALLIGLLGWSCTSDEALPTPDAAGKADVQAVMSRIDQYLTEHSGSAALDNIAGAYVNESENTVVVGLVDCGEREIADFKSTVCNDAALRFEQSDREPGFEPEVVAVEPQDICTRAVGGSSVGQVTTGARLWKKLTDGTMQYCGTVAYRAMRNGVKGFVTSGQVLSVGAPVYVKVGTGYYVVGTCVAQKNGGTANAAFCTLGAGVNELSNLIPNQTGSSYSTYIPPFYPAVGSYAVMWGAQTLEMTGKPTSGRITAQSASFVGTGNVSYTGMMKVDYGAMRDDIGGMVVNLLTQMSPVVPGKCDVLGVHCTYGYFSYVSSVNSALGIMLY